ncbi:DNA topoisomerase I [Salinisphaera orenii MK-B5]|uniref:DNA topoisomerase 1 n=1 Tax=Salinisphaera orenii MK-B5 TaxID=856730 RepID=A0A423PGG7_9GAMM|nr:DNA topoisomerase I [Salinisphaera orenii]ROO24623.1 DNA topoisomerase I [Salinisphaera orenii MK-B5]
MSRNLVIVESPAKARTIEKYLGKDYEVLASYGHVRDLIPKEGAVDTEHDFAMRYDVIDRNAKQVDKIARSLKKSDALLLATDPDREGEAIAWHLLELLRERGLLEDKHVARVVFHEITKRAVAHAVENPRDISSDLVNAQQARRALDYLVGFNLSPLLWKKVQRGLSAGRVQSPALRLICERDAEIEAFVPEEYWKIEASVEKDGTPFGARLSQLDGEKVEQFTVNNHGSARDALTTLTAAAGGQLTEDSQESADAPALRSAGGELRVAKVERKQRKRNPAPPFITSTLQQEAARKLGFTAKRTMRTAQSLYEGVRLGDGDETGLITYMRTDSVNLANDAVAELRQLIADRYGDKNLPDAPRTFRTKSKNAQEAHEAIRPTASARVPAEIKQYLASDQFRLYELIWQRTVASQMMHALFDTVSADLAAGDDDRHLFRASGRTLREAGFLAVYKEGKDDDKEDDDGDKRLPPLEENERLSLVEIVPTQHFTEPPPRFTEAALVKTLEEYDIGRPSTYASIISTLQDREYVEMDGKAFMPTPLGKIVNKFLTDHFTRYVDYAFTANLEDRLDAVSRGEEQWQPLLREFWDRFSDQIESKQDLSREEVAQARELGTDPESGKPVIVRIGRFGPFVQIGSKDDEEKPKFAGLRKGQDMDKITLDEALYLFNLPRDLGETPEGEEIQVNIGRFGPYVRFGKTFASLKEDDPYTISKERALEVIAEKKEADAKKLIKHFEDAGIKVQHGPFGPYITDGKKNASVPKDQEPADLTLEQCQEIIAKAPEKKKRGRKGSAKTAGAKKSAAGDGRTAKASGSKTTASKTTSSKAKGTKTDGAPSKAAKSGTGKSGGTKTKATGSTKGGSAKTTPAKSKAAGKDGDSGKAGGGSRRKS